MGQFDVIGRAKVIIESAVDQSSIGKSGDKIGSTLRKSAIIGAAAVGTLAVAGFSAVRAFEDAEAVSRKLGNVLNNMGVGDATEQVSKLADQLQRTTGVDDELIRGGETILATFSEIAKSAGEVGGTFERATKLSLDLAAAGFGNVESASVMLGKALQDPIKGVTALSRAGVTFTEVQKEQIKQFIKTGDSAKAQNLILKEVEKQVGGTAEAGAKSSDKIARGIDEVKESIGNLILKLIGGKKKNDAFSDSLFTLADSLNKLAESDAWHDLGVVLHKLGKLLEWVADTTERIIHDFKSISDLSIGDIFDNILPGDQGAPNSPSSNDITKLFLAGLGRASGGPASGWTLVGEQGPELVDLPNGSYVHSNSESKSMVAGSGSGFSLTQVFNGPNSLAQARAEADWAAKYGTRFGSATAAGAL